MRSIMKSALITFYFFFASSTNVRSAQDVTVHPHWRLLNQGDCGESPATTRIIGGTDAAIGQFPWMARLGYVKPSMGIYRANKMFECAGSLINNLYVLTAAHCITDRPRHSLVLIRLGEHDDRTTVDCLDDVCAPPAQDFKPSEVIVHKMYHKEKKTRNKMNDIALIRLDRPATISDYVLSICLPYGRLLTKNYLGKKLEVAGWGLDNVKTNHRSPLLKVVRVPITVPNLCQKYTDMGEGQLCAGGVVGYDSCGGDSGGPMMSPEAVDGGSPKYFLIGVISFGKTACGSNNPAVYTNVAKYMTWILDHIY